jgi:hypothetical protein
LERREKVPFDFGFEVGDFGVVVDVSRVGLQDDGDGGFGRVFPRKPVGELGPRAKVFEELVLYRTC